MPVRKCLLHCKAGVQKQRDWWSRKFEAHSEKHGVDFANQVSLVLSNSSSGLLGVFSSREPCSLAETECWLFSMLLNL